MKNNIKVIKMYNEMLDVNFINIEIEGLNKNDYKNDEDIIKLMKDEDIKKIVKEYIINNIDINIIKDYWFDDNDLDDDIILDNNKDRDKFFKMYKNDINEKFNFMFNNDNIENEINGWWLIIN